MKVLALQNWEEFQHYKDRDPPWVKLYRDLLTSESWVLGTDLSRTVQVASMMLAARYKNKIPLRLDLLKKVMSLTCDDEQLTTALDHLVSTNFLEIQEVTEEKKSAEQSASKALASCASEKSREEQRRADQKVPTEPVAQDATEVPRGTNNPEILRVFEHWRTSHRHPRSVLDDKRAKLIRVALQKYTEADLCQAITGYLNSPHHMGQNDRNTKFDDIELFLRDAKHIDAGLAFYAQPPRTDLSAQTRRIVAQTEDWTPPETRRAAN